MIHAELVAALGRARILSAAVIDDPTHAVPLARAPLAGGLEVMEVTFRNAHAAECIRRIRAEVPAMMVGAGTLLTIAQVDEARAAGAAFGSRRASIRPSSATPSPRVLPSRRACSRPGKWNRRSSWAAPP